MVRRELGPDASVLHTREVRKSRLLGLMRGAAQIEVLASAEVRVPSRLTPEQRLGGAARPPQPPAPGTMSTPNSADTARRRTDPQGGAAPTTNRPGSVHAPHHAAYSAPPAVPADAFASPGGSARPGAAAPDDDQASLAHELHGQLKDLQAMVEQLCRRAQHTRQHDLPEPLFRLYTSLIDAEVSEELARELVERLRHDTPASELSDPAALRTRVARAIESEIAVCGPIRPQGAGAHVVALVGPTGVGKTTTIAKLAAHYRLRQRLKVGLITVDTYRIAAVEQLRTYADIIDLPMHVVSTPREIRGALNQLEGFDLVLMDTAGRSPRDEVKIQELKAFLHEARADEVHLVLSSVTGAAALARTAERFADVGTTALILTKLDEATALGNVLPLVRSSRLPLSYVTNGQNVPDDIQPAQSQRLARLILGMAGE